MAHCSNPRSRFSQSLLTIGFALAISAPLVLQISGDDGGDRIENREKRTASSAPDLPRDLKSWASYPKQVEGWYGERFGMRDQLLWTYHWIKLVLFERSPTERIVIGPNRWLFSDSYRALQSNRGGMPFSAEDLASWREALLARKNWLAERGIDYALVLVPGKAAVYPEELPARFEQRAPSRREQFLAEMQREPDLLVVDLISPFIAGKTHDTPEDHVFYPLGLHWTPRGAMIGNEAIMSALADRHRRITPGLRERTRSAPVGGGDDFSQRFLVPGLFEQKELSLSAGYQSRSHLQKTLVPERDYGVRAWLHQDQSLTRLLILRDSFGNMLAPHLAEHFALMHDVPTLNFSPALVESLRPDIVIELFAEHTFSYQIPHVQHILGMADLEDQFASAETVLLPSTHEKGEARVASHRGTVIQLGPQGVRVQSDGSATVLLPEFAWHAEALSILKLDITAPEYTHLTLYYPIPGPNQYRLKQAPPSINRYRVKQSSLIPLAPGRQTVYVALAPPRMAGPIAIMPGNAPGEYIIHDLEARAATR